MKEYLFFFFLILIVNFYFLIIPGFFQIFKYFIDGSGVDSLKFQSVQSTCILFKVIIYCHGQCLVRVNSTYGIRNSQELNLSSSLHDFLGIFQKFLSEDILENSLQRLLLKLSDFLYKDISEYSLTETFE